MKRSNSLFIVPVILALAVLTGLLVLLPASTRAATATSAASQDVPVTITYWHHNTGAREEFLNQLVNEFNATNPYSITVLAEYAGNYGEIYNRVIDGLQNDGALPNVVVAYPNSFADFARYGQVRFLDTYFNDPTIGITDTADFAAGTLDYYRLGEYGNQLAGIQNGRSIEIMYYNADLLVSAGITVPTTWDEFETACISLTTETVSGTIPGMDASAFATWLWSRGGELLSDDLNYARFDEQPGIDSLFLFQTLIDNHYARLPLGGYEEIGAFGNGQVGFTFSSSAVIPYYRDAMNNGANDAWGVTHVPAVPGNEVVSSYGAGQGVLHHSETEDRAAWLFIRWLTDRNQTARWAARSGYFPVRISAAAHISMTEKLASDPQYAQAFDLLPLGRSEPGIRGYDAIRAIIGDAMTDILQDGAGVTETLQFAADEADAILAVSGPDSSVIPPTGGTLTYTNTQGISATVQFPAGALAVTETVSYVPLDDLPTDGLAFALVPNLTFSQPVTITLHYRDEDIVGMDKSELKLYNYDWSINSWVDANPCGGYVRNPDDNILQAALCHFSDYAMMDWPFRVYLPNVTRNYPLPGVAFHDLNGNGVWDNVYQVDESDQTVFALEPTIPDLQVCVDGMAICVTTNADGMFGGLPDGPHTIYVPGQDIYRHFIIDINTERRIADGLSVAINKGGVAVPLGVGPYRNPFPEQTHITVTQWVDMDNRSCLGPFPDRDCEFRLDWLGGDNTYDGHQGNDAGYGMGIPSHDLKVHPMRAGEVFMVRAVDDNPELEGYEVIIRDTAPFTDGLLSYQTFVHMRDAYVVQGQMVTPQDVIGGGTPDQRGAIHFGVYPFVPQGVHPLDGDFRIPPHADRYIFPFDQLWTGLGAFVRVNQYILKEGIVEQIYP